MFIKILTATVLTAGMSAAAFADTSVNAGGQMRWDRQTGDAFFITRSDDEIRANFGKLSAEQQAMVREDCKTVKDRNTTDNANTRTSFIDQSMDKVCSVVDM